MKLNYLMLGLSAAGMTALTAGASLAAGELSTRPHAAVLAAVAVSGVLSLAFFFAAVSSPRPIHALFMISAVGAFCGACMAAFSELQDLAFILGPMIAVMAATLTALFRDVDADMRGGVLVVSFGTEALVLYLFLTLCA